METSIAWAVLTWGGVISGGCFDATSGPGGLEDEAVLSWSIAELRRRTPLERLRWAKLASPREGPRRARPLHELDPTDRWFLDLAPLLLQSVTATAVFEQVAATFPNDLDEVCVRAGGGQVQPDPRPADHARAPGSGATTPSELEAECTRAIAARSAEEGPPPWGIRWRFDSGRSFSCGAVSYSRAPDGWVVDGLCPKSIAERSGLRSGDRILSLDGVVFGAGTTVGIVNVLDRASRVVALVERDGRRVEIILDRTGER